MELLTWDDADQRLISDASSERVAVPDKDVAFRSDHHDEVFGTFK